MSISSRKLAGNGSKGAARETISITALSKIGLFDERLSAMPLGSSDPSLRMATSRSNVPEIFRARASAG